MKIPQLSGLVALGLLCASPAAASVCRLSSVSSASSSASSVPSSVSLSVSSSSASSAPSSVSSSVSSSSASSAPSSVSSSVSSSSASASPSVAPALPCDTNVVVNGDFTDNDNSWNTTGDYATVLGCGDYGLCMEMNFTSGSVQISQDIPTVVGAEYTFTVTYNAVQYTTAAFSCNIQSGETTYHFLTFLVEGTWEPYTGGFQSEATTSTLTCSLSSDSYVLLELTDFYIAVPCLYF